MCIMSALLLNLFQDGGIIPSCLPQKSVCVLNGFSFSCARIKHREHDLHPDVLICQLVIYFKSVMQLLASICCLQESGFVL